MEKKKEEKTEGQKIRRTQLAERERGKERERMNCSKRQTKTMIKFKNLKL